ncbi:MAG: phosphoenolpyruvate carboxylase [Deltaproteobacteria bacterium]|nr:MAG: phosphoenolpyruvate carboxylase [Deltaproteobacteria bacterium]
MTDPHAPLRDDVRLLGRLLGDTLRQQHGEALFQLVEDVRTLSKAAHAGDDSSFARLRALFDGLAAEDAVTVARAFSHFLTLANIAEQHHRVRRRRQYRLDPEASPQRASFEETFSRLRDSGLSPERLHAAVCDQQVELVLTAHPTEVARRTLLQKHNRIACLLAERDRPDLTADERRDAERTLLREILACWTTDEIRRERPTPVDEARGGLVAIENTLWDVVPAHLRELSTALERHTGQPLPLDAAPIRFGSWMGGDRDGNPNVTPDVTRETILLGRWMAADLFHREVDALRAELSMREASPALRERVGDAREPYRALLRDVRDRLRRTRDALADRLAGRPTAPDNLLLDTADLREPLLLCHDSLCATGAGPVADGRLADILRRLAVFGLTLVRLDLRQEAPRHAEALDAITRHLGLGSYLAWSEDERQRWLATELANPRPLIPDDLDPSDDVRDVLDTFRVAAEAGPDALGAYVISMAATPSDVLAVDLLQKACHVRHRLRVVPLFETEADLRTAPDTLRTLFDLPVYRDRIAGRQEVMIGYSDSAKDAGRLAAAWALYVAQENIVTAARDHDVRLTLFHGRGGSVGRGGGPTWLAILSQPPGSVDGRLRVTEQGEMIQAKFGMPGIALRTLELYATAVLQATVQPPRDPEPAWRARMDRLARTAMDAYRGVVREDPRFVPYFRRATPEPELGALNIGSRPARRRNDGGVESLRAIPWIFAWTQTRLLLPSWLGTGEALAAELAADPDGLRDMYRDWPFFQSTLDLIEMVLAKADTRIAALYDDLLVPEDQRDIGAELRLRWQRTADAVREVSGIATLLQRNPVLRRSIDVRNPYVDPINLVQAAVLRRLRAEDDPEPDLLDALVITVNGIAAGMRNTG